MHSLQAQLVWNSIVYKGRWFVQLYIHIHTATSFYGQAHVVVAVVVVVVTKVSSHHHRHHRHHRLTLRCATTTRLIINRTTTTTTGPQTLPCQDRSSVRGLQAVVAGNGGQGRTWRTGFHFYILYWSSIKYKLKVGGDKGKKYSC